MNSYRPLVLIIIALLIFGLTACERSIGPVAGVPTPTGPAAGPPPVTGDVMGQLELFVTQTAMAAQGLGQVSPQVTPEAPAAETPAGEEPAPPPAEETPAVEPAPEGQPSPAAPTEEPAAPPAEEGPAPTAVVVPTATPGIPSTYTLQGGEHPFCIARRFNVDPGELLRANGLAVNSTVFPGTTLNIPQSGNPFPGTRALQPHPTTHTVQSSETINAIACQYGDVDPNAIAFANGLAAPYNLSAGQTLQIP